MCEQTQMTNIEETMSDSQRRNWAWRRWTARGIDEFVGTAAIFSVVMTMASFLPDPEEPSAVEGAMALLTFALITLPLPISIFSSTVQYALFGGTFGKWICGVRVSDEQGKNYRAGVSFGGTSRFLSVVNGFGCGCLSSSGMSYSTIGLLRASPHRMRHRPCSGRVRLVRGVGTIFIWSCLFLCWPLFNLFFSKSCMREALI